MAWKIELSRAAENSLAALDREAARRIKRYLTARIATEEDPRRFGKALKAGLAGFWRYRVGDYRIICNIQDEKVIVLVIDVGHRSRIYARY